MGKHQKEVNCPGCNGRKTQKESQDGTIVEVPYRLCNGTGKQPS